MKTNQPTNPTALNSSCQSHTQNKSSDSMLKKYAQNILLKYQTTSNFIYF